MENKNIYIYIYIIFINPMQTDWLSVTDMSLTYVCFWYKRLKHGIYFIKLHYEESH